MTPVGTRQLALASVVIFRAVSPAPLSTPPLNHRCDGLRVERCDVAIRVVLSISVLNGVVNTDMLVAMLNQTRP